MTNIEAATLIVDMYGIVNRYGVSECANYGEAVAMACSALLENKNEKSNK